MRILLFYRPTRCGYTWDAQTNARRHYPLVVVGVHTHAVILQVEGVLTKLDMFQFVFVQVWPTPQAGINDVRETLSTGNLQPPVQRALDGDAFAGVNAVGGDGSDERVQLVLLLLQLLHQTLDGSLGEALILPPLTMAHQTVNNAQAGIVAVGGSQ